MTIRTALAREGGPAAAALVASVLAMVYAPSLFVGAVPLAVLAAALRLRWKYGSGEPKRLELVADQPAIVASTDTEPA